MSTTIQRQISHQGVTVPTFLYGTAWKEDRTTALTQMALEAGFLGIDTANQRRHYYEAGVGDALKQVWESGKLTRQDLFLQTKFTYVGGQDHRLPYDPQADYTTQVQQSFARSLEHLHTDYLDAYLLHGPSSHQGLTVADRDVWQAMEALQQSGNVKLIGISNVNASQLQALVSMATVKPAFVQNRCYASTQWDAHVRQVCREHGILYQGFSLLTANGRELNTPAVWQIAKRLHATLPQVVFCFALQLGMIPLTGTTSQTHMVEDLESYQFQLTQEEMNILEHIAT